MSQPVEELLSQAHPFSPKVYFKSNCIVLRSCFQQFSISLRLMVWIKGEMSEV